MKKFIAILSALMMMILAIVPMSASAAANTMYVDSSNGLTVRVHKYDHDGNVLCNLGVGFPVSVIGGSDNGYTQITFRLNGRRYTGWIMDQFLSVTDAATKRQRFTNVNNSFDVTVRPSSANGKVSLWPSCSKRGDGIRVMEPGESLTVLRASHAWYYVMDSYGNVGYVAKAYVKKL